MKRLASFLSIALAASIGATAPVSAVETDDDTSLHGSFTTGLGVLEDGTTEDLGRSGAWNVKLTPAGPRVTGVLSTLQGQCDLMPCHFVWPLQFLPWEQAGENVYVVEDFKPGQVTFDFTLTVVPGGTSTMRVEITDCPFGWDYWVFSGPTTTG